MYIYIYIHKISSILTHVEKVGSSVVYYLILSSTRVRLCDTTLLLSCCEELTDFPHGPWRGIGPWYSDDCVYCKKVMTECWLYILIMSSMIVALVVFFVLMFTIWTSIFFTWLDLTRATNLVQAPVPLLVLVLLLLLSLSSLIPSLSSSHNKS